ncbi:Avirulence (Avh) protein [Phytophthora megakarya]|uniref:RxLR effector protein n=1 Tax=Phytophthora megakarya TaxID=4795 RepID=A0A225ULX0_9STRA|nr:Avirulence (Avh) protein [Phytophthora megakarya]
MRFLLLFVVATIIINVASGLEQHITSKTTALTRSFDTAATTKRSLRTTKTEAVTLPGTDDGIYSEERVNFQGVATGLSEKIKKLLQKLSNMFYRIRGKTPSDVINSLLASRNWVGNENKKLIKWFRFAKSYRKAKGISDGEIYALLKPIQIQRESQLATLFQSMKSIPDLKNMGETMQMYQFKLWKDRGETLKSVKKLLGNQATSNQEIYRAFKEIA